MQKYVITRLWSINQVLKLFANNLQYYKSSLAFVSFVMLHYHSGLSTLTKCHCEAVGLYEFYHHSDIHYFSYKICIFFIESVQRHFKVFLRVLRNSWFSEGWTVLTETIVLLYDPKVIYWKISMQCSISLDRFFNVLRSMYLTSLHSFSSTVVHKA